MYLNQETAHISKSLRHCKALYMNNLFHLNNRNNMNVSMCVMNGRILWGLESGRFLIKKWRGHCASTARSGGPRMCRQPWSASCRPRSPPHTFARWRGTPCCPLKLRSGLPFLTAATKISLTLQQLRLRNNNLLWLCSFFFLIFRSRRDMINFFYLESKFLIDRRRGV